MVEPGIYFDLAVNCSSEIKELSTRSIAWPRTTEETSMSRSNALASSTWEDAEDATPLYAVGVTVGAMGAGMPGRQCLGRARGGRGQERRKQEVRGLPSSGL